MLKFAVCGAVATLVLGCVDARKSFDEFADRAGFTDASTIDRPPSTISDISGTFLYAVRGGFETSNDPAYYVQFLATFTLTETATGATLDSSLVPLCTAAGACPNGRVELPPPFVTTGMAVATDGTFAGGVVGTLPAAANPLSGTAQALDGAVAGIILSADVVCGDVTGTVAGINLAGSTFAAIRVTDTSPGALPAPVAACPSGGPDAGVDAMPDPPVDAGVEDA